MLQEKLSVYSLAVLELGREQMGSCLDKGLSLGLRSPLHPNCPLKMSGIGVYRSQPT
jgi:hypothetical protein